MYGTLNLHAAHFQRKELLRIRRRHQLLFGLICFISIILLGSFVTILRNTSASDLNFSIGINGGLVCGDGVLDGGEYCDDGIALNGEPLQCNSLCDGYTLAVCGNTIIESAPYGSEQCDDGNVSNNDGCSSICANEGGGATTSNPGGPPINLPPIPPLPITTSTESELRHVQVLIFDGSIFSTYSQNADQPQEYIPTIKISRPVFSGSVDEPYAVLRFTVFSSAPVIGIVRADSQGRWRWQVPVDLEDGPHELYMEVYTADGERLFVTLQPIQFYIVTDTHSLPEGEADVTVIETPDSSQIDDSDSAFEFPDILYQPTHPETWLLFDTYIWGPVSIGEGDPLNLRSLIHYYGPEVVAVPVSLHIYDQDNTEVYVTSRSETVRNLVTELAWSISDAPLEPGYYTVVLQLEYNSVVYVSDIRIKVGEVHTELVSGNVFFSRTRIINSLGLALIIFLLLLMWQYRRLRLLGHVYDGIDEVDLKKIGYVSR